jgi:hypothetical protein
MSVDSHTVTVTHPFTSTAEKKERLNHTELTLALSFPAAPSPQAHPESTLEQALIPLEETHGYARHTE